MCGIKFGFPVHSFTSRKPTLKPDVRNPKISPAGVAALDKKFKEWLQKGYIRLLEPHEKAIFHPVTVIPKRTGGHRPIINLSYPNKLSVNDGIPDVFRRCSLPSTSRVMDLIHTIGPEGWVAAIDLKDAWKQFHILPEHQFFFGWCWKGFRVVETRFPFGWAQPVNNFGVLCFICPFFTF